MSTIKVKPVWEYPPLSAKETTGYCPPRMNRHICKCGVVFFIRKENLNPPLHCSDKCRLRDIGGLL